MAMVNDRPDQPDSQSPPVRVVIKLTRAARTKLGEAAIDADSEALLDLQDIAPGSRIAAYFSEYEKLSAVNTDPFDRYVAIEIDDPEAAAALAAKLREASSVEEAYVEGGPTPPPVNPADDPRSVDQGYLDAAPTGIDARWAWQWADGAGIMFVDLEQGWTLDHDDLKAAGITLISGRNQDWHGHGTAVLGQMVAVDNQGFGIGIAPGATARVVSQWRNDGSYNTAAAILSAAGVMSAGDVLLLEAQTRIGSLRNMPVEVEAAVFDAIRHVIDKDIVVVEAAGNGGNDLDTYRDGANRLVLNRASADFRDSGAIMVGAASALVPHVRRDFSNHGSRIDCYGWGDNIYTIGDGAQGTSTTDQTSFFGGTSGASPMVAGAAVLLQSWRKKYHGTVYNPVHVRKMLRSVALNTASANPANDRIGVMPNLKAILEAANTRQFETIKYFSSVYLLFGLVDDGPGMIWIPGKGPVPVDPDWGKRALSAPSRDLIAALAMSEIATLIDDGATRTNLTEALTAAMRSAVDRIAGSAAGRPE